MMPDDTPAGAPPAGAPPVATAPSAADVAAQLAAMRAQLEADRARLAPPSRLERFCSSGVFFILLGGLLLLAAYFGLVGGVHSSFSFVLVVLGMATLLYGTGTQGAGRLESATAAAKYNVAIAGGAGVLALAIGFGMIEYGPQMQRAFGVETRYVVAMLRPHADGASRFSGYWAEFDVDGVAIPSVRRGDVIMAFVPYFDTQVAATKRVSYRILPQDPQIRDPALKPSVNDTFELPLSRINRRNSGVDFPIYDEVPPIDMRSSSSTAAVLNAAAVRSLAPAGGQSAPNPTAPALVVAQ
jgi:hypothetical protein